MKLNNKGLENKNAWEAAGYALPQYDREAVAARTKQNPFWIHFGAGNIFRAFQANVVQDLLNKGEQIGMNRGLAQGIVETGCAFGMPKEMILNRLQERLHISAQRAQEYFAMFSGQQPV